MVDKNMISKVLLVVKLIYATGNMALNCSFASLRYTRAWKLPFSLLFITGILFSSIGSANVLSGPSCEGQELIVW